MQKIWWLCSIFGSFFLCYTSKCLQKIWWLFAPFWGVFSYATQVTVCKKFGDCSIFGSFSYATQVKILQKIWWFFAPFFLVFLMPHCTVNIHKKFGDCLLHFREVFFMLHREKFAKKLATFLLHFREFFFSYAAQVKVCNKFWWLFLSWAISSFKGVKKSLG